MGAHSCALPGNHTLQHAQRMLGVSHLHLLLPQNQDFTERSEASLLGLEGVSLLPLPLSIKPVLSAARAETLNSCFANSAQSASSCYCLTSSVPVASSASLQEPPPAAALWAFQSTGLFQSSRGKGLSLFYAQYWGLPPRLCPLTYHPMPRDRLLRLGHEVGT